jgi:uncharacterized protein (DUF427 family)
MPKTTASWNGKIIAASDHCIAVEGNAYFPPESLNREYFKDSPHTSVCHWKGNANYFDLVVDGKTNAGAAWVYNAPSPAAEAIAGYVAFWKGVEVKGGENATALSR